MTSGLNQELITNAVGRITYLTRSLAQNSSCQWFALADVGIDVVFGVTQKN